MVKESISNLKKISMHMNNLDKMSEVELIREGKIHNTRIQYCSHIFHIQVL